MKWTRKCALLSLLGATFFLPLACGSKPAANAAVSYGGDGGGTPVAQPCAPGQLCPPSVATVPATGPAPPPTTPATAPMPGVTDAVDIGLKLAAVQYAPGTTAEGLAAKAALAENGHSYFIVNMDASKCYTVVGFGLGVTDLDLTLLAPPLYTVSAGQDGTAGPTAVIQKMCPLIPLPIPYKIDIYAKKGSGLVGAQVYSRPK